MALALVARLGPVLAAAVCVAGVALGDIDLHFVWQVWHLVASAFILCGRRGAHGSGLALVERFRRVFVWQGVAFGDIEFHFVWQVWHLATSAFTLCGRRGAWRHRPSLCGRCGT